MVGALGFMPGAKAMVLPWAPWYWAGASNLVVGRGPEAQALSGEEAGEVTLLREGPWLYRLTTGFESWVFCHLPGNSRQAMYVTCLNLFRYCKV